MSRIVITASRTWPDPDRMFAVLDEEFGAAADPWAAPGEVHLTLVHGAAQGGDSIAALWAWWRQIGGWRGLNVEVHPANWARDGRAAGVLRNLVMLQRPDVIACLAFIHNGSRGATHCATKAQEMGIRTRIERA